MKDDDQNILKKSKQALDESVEHLDAQTLSRLNQARQKALSQKTHVFPLNISWANISWKNISWAPASAFAALSIAIIASSLFLSTPNNTLTSADEVEFMASNEDLELMEDLEFVAWLIEQDNAS